jgi:hypothetical protein
MSHAINDGLEDARVPEIEPWLKAVRNAAQRFYSHVKQRKFAVNELEKKKELEGLDPTSSEWLGRCGTNGHFKPCPDWKSDWHCICPAPMRVPGWTQDVKWGDEKLLPVSFLILALSSSRQCRDSHGGQLLPGYMKYQEILCRLIRSLSIDVLGAVFHLPVSIQIDRFSTVTQYHHVTAFTLAVHMSHTPVVQTFMTLRVPPDFFAGRLRPKGDNRQSWLWPVWTPVEINASLIKIEMGHRRYNREIQSPIDEALLGHLIPDLIAIVLSYVRLPL